MHAKWLPEIVDRRVGCRGGGVGRGERLRALGWQSSRGGVKPRLAPPSFAALPVAFVENRGQTDADVRYYARGDRYGFYFTDQAIVLAFQPERAGACDAGNSVVASLQFVGANPQARIEGAQVPGLVNYLHGSDPVRLADGSAPLR